MGQRHQIFIKVNNPIKTTAYISDVDKKRGRQIFGNNKTTIIALHNQWLYGASAVMMVDSILRATFNADDDNRVFGKNPYLNDGVSGWVRDAMSMLQTVTNPNFPRGVGIERMHFLNIEEPYMRSDCTAGDNNDGITIIDAINRKYCMVNISDIDGEEGIYTLPTMKPCSGYEYVKAYYPEAEEEKSDAVKSVKDYKVLTLKEVARIFPNNFKKELLKEFV